MAAELQERARLVLAKAIAAMDIHIAYGRGNAAWDDAPPPNAGSLNTALIDEIGRTRVTEKLYVTRDDAGAIITPDGTRYSASAEPTRYLLIRATFGYGEATEEPIREMAVFVGTRVRADVPPGQYYVTPDQVTNIGDVYTLERRAAVKRPANKQDMEQVILPF